MRAKGPVPDHGRFHTSGTDGGAERRYASRVILLIALLFGACGDPAQGAVRARTLAYAARGERLVALTAAGVRIWATLPYTELPAPPLTGEVLGADVHADTLFVRGAQGPVRAWDLRGATALPERVAPEGAVGVPAAAWTGGRMVQAGSGGARVWDGAGEVDHETAGAPEAVAIRSDGARWAVAAAGRVAVYAIDGREPVAQVDVPGAVSRLLFDGDGRLWVGFVDGAVGVVEGDGRGG